MIVNIETGNAGDVDPDEIAALLARGGYYVLEVNVNLGQRVWRDGGEVFGTWQP